MGVLLLPRLIQSLKTSIARCHISEFLNPLIQNAESQFLLISFGQEAVVDNDTAKKCPFWNIFRQLILRSDFFLLFLDVKFNLLQ